MIERADQLVLDFVSRVADAAHGRLRPEQRLDFVRRLRARIDQERGAIEDPKQVAKVIAKFGTPAQLVEREIQRLTGGPPLGPSESPLDDQAPTQRLPPVTATFPVVMDDALPPPSRSVPPGVAAGRRAARARLSRGTRRPSAMSRVRKMAMAGANPMTTDGRDAWSIIFHNRRESAGLALLVIAALLTPLHLPTVAIFPIPVVIWGVAALTILSGEGWQFGDRLIGAGAPIVAFLVGGAIVGAVRTQNKGLEQFATSFGDASKIMFILGTAGAVTWLGYRLLDPPASPPAPPGRGGPVRRR
ncbi:hypothetical protein J5X84_22890 [Streptosporangiaceae bacterium NEAU-GS5]|nr:hypothetical protein [Streptosporangiaceae bacterium NEAU-GS5]